MPTPALEYRFGLFKDSGDSGIPWFSEPGANEEPGPMKVTGSFGFKNFEVSRRARFEARSSKGPLERPRYVVGADTRRHLLRSLRESSGPQALAAHSLVWTPLTPGLEALRSLRPTEKGFPLYITPGSGLLSGAGTPETPGLGQSGGPQVASDLRFLLKITIW